MALAILLSPAAAGDLDALPADRANQILADLQAYAREPGRAWPIKRLRGFDPPLYRLRSGDFRVLFRLGVGVLEAYRVIDRKDLERALRRLR